MDDKVRQFSARKTKAERLVILGGVIAIIGVISFVALASRGPIGVIIIIPGVIVSIVGGAQFKKISTEFKEIVLTDLVASFVDDGVFNPHQGLSEQSVYATEFVKRADRFHTEDYLKGSIDGVEFVSSDVKLEEKHVEHTKDGTRTYYETYFLGRIFIFEFNKSFDGYLQVLERGRPTRRRGYDKIKLESVAFNKKFNTFSTNEHAAFYVLTPHFMEALMDFEKNNKGTISFSFIDNILYIGINNFRDTFELRMFRPINEATFEEFKRELLVIKDIVTELRLNNNIFKKE